MKVSLEELVQMLQPIIKNKVAGMNAVRILNSICVDNPCSELLRRVVLNYYCTINRAYHITKYVTISGDTEIDWDSEECTEKHILDRAAWVKKIDMEGRPLEHVLSTALHRSEFECIDLIWFKWSFDQEVLKNNSELYIV